MEEVVAELLKVSPFVGLLGGLAFYFMKKYNEMINLLLEKSNTQATALIEALSRNTQVMERVERKLDEK